MIENLHGITSDVELARTEELLSKRRALELFENGILDHFEVGTFAGLAKIHGYLFQDIYAFAGRVRSVNLAKGGFRFAPVLYLTDALKAIDGMPQQTYDQIVEKYVEMNVAHPFREGNGRATRIWLDCMFKRGLGKVVDWSCVSREDYLLAMERSPVRDTEIKALLEPALTDAVNDRQVYMKGIDVSYRYEGYASFSSSEIRENDKAHVEEGTHPSVDVVARASEVGADFLREPALGLAEDVRGDMVYAEAQEYGIVPDDSTTSPDVPADVLAELGISPSEVGQ